MTDKTEPQINKKEIAQNDIKNLSQLEKIDYELIRVETADKFKMRIGVLDDLVEAERTKSKKCENEIGLFQEIKPWESPVNLSALLDEIIILLKKYLSFSSENEPRTIALWIIHTYCIDAAYISPILFITSPEMRSGKSTLLAMLQRMVFKCVAASSISPSVIYRLISKHHPTIICDEADTYLTSNNEDLRCILNAGHSRDTAGILRTNPTTLEPESFNAFGAKCIAAIKNLPGTVEDRSIIIKMRRMLAGSKKEKMRMNNTTTRKQFADIQSKCLRFTNGNLEQLKTVNPMLPKELNDRAADNWYPLFQIAMFASNDWLKYTNEAALKLSNIENENKSIGIELLEDIQNLFETQFKHLTQIPTATLIEALCSDDEAPWATYNFKRSDTKITARQIANLLLPYAIKPINNIGIDKRKGYSKASFQDAFSRYICPESQDIAATSAPSAITSTDAINSLDETGNLSAPIRYNRSTEIAGADESALEQQQQISQTLIQQGVAAIADEMTDFDDSLTYV